jgi:hypothetical protein
MGEAEDCHTEADDLSGRPEEDRGGSESKVGEGEAGGLTWLPKFAKRVVPYPPRDGKHCRQLESDREGEEPR